MDFVENKLWCTSQHDFLKFHLMSELRHAGFAAMPGTVLDKSVTDASGFLTPDNVRSPATSREESAMKNTNCKRATGEPNMSLSNVYMYMCLNQSAGYVVVTNKDGAGSQ